MHERHNCNKLISYAVIIVTNQAAKQYGTTRANMPRKKNDRVMMSCKTITSKLLTVVGLLVEPSSAI